MNQYEVMYVIDPALEDGARVELINRFSELVKKNGGEIDRVDEWGKRRLAYAINYKNEGYYVLVNFSASSDLPREIERVLQISEDVLRYLIVRVEEKHTSVKPRPVPVRPAPAARPVETAPAAAEPAAEPVEEAQAPAEEAPAVEQE